MKAYEIISEYAGTIFTDADMQEYCGWKMHDIVNGMDRKLKRATKAMILLMAQRRAKWDAPYPTDVVLGHDDLLEDNAAPYPEETEDYVFSDYGLFDRDHHLPYYHYQLDEIMGDDRPSLLAGTYPRGLGAFSVQVRHKGTTYYAVLYKWLAVQHVYGDMPVRINGLIVLPTDTEGVADVMDKVKREVWGI